MFAASVSGARREPAALPARLLFRPRIAGLFFVLPFFRFEGFSLAFELFEVALPEPQRRDGEEYAAQANF